MTLQTSDFTAKHEFLVKCDYKAEFNETAAARARILYALDAACAAVESARDPEALEPAYAAQVAALDAIFRQYAKVAVLCCDLASVQTYMGFALKAQTQCRVTLDTLERIKTSRAAAPAKPQAQPRPPAPSAEESQNAANELLRRWLERSERPANSEKSPVAPELRPVRRSLGEGGSSEGGANELLKAQLLGGVSAAGFPPMPVEGSAKVDPPNPQNSTNEVLEGTDDLER